MKKFKEERLKTSSDLNIMRLTDSISESRILRRLIENLGIKFVNNSRFVAKRMSEILSLSSLNFFKTLIPLNVSLETSDKIRKMVTGEVCA